MPPGQMQQGQMQQGQMQQGQMQQGQMQQGQMQQGQMQQGQMQQGRMQQGQMQQGQMQQGQMHMQQGQAPQYNPQQRQIAQHQLAQQQQHLTQQQQLVQQQLRYQQGPPAVIHNPQQQMQHMQQIGGPIRPAVAPRSMAIAQGVPQPQIIRPGAQLQQPAQQRAASFAPQQQLQQAVPQHAAPSDQVAPSMQQPVRRGAIHPSLDKLLEMPQRPVLEADRPIVDNIVCSLFSSPNIKAQFTPSSVPAPLYRAQGAHLYQSGFFANALPRDDERQSISTTDPQISRLSGPPKNYFEVLA